MPRNVRQLLAILVLCGLWISPTLAGGRVALVIGNSTYQYVGALPNPKKDAADIATALRSIGFTVTEIHDADRDSFQEALGAFSEAAADADVGIIYYAGHGIEVNKDNYLIPVDASLVTDRRLRFETISLDDVVGTMDGVTGLKMVLVDACRNNPFAASMKLTKASRSVGRGLAAVEAAGGTVIAYAAKEGMVASDGEGRNSPFASALLASIKQPGLEIQFLLREVRDSVLTETNGEQEPYISASLPRDPIYLVPPMISTGQNQAGEGSVSSNAEQIFDTTVADFQLAKEMGTLEAWDAFLNRHGTESSSFHVELAKVARRKLAMNVPAPQSPRLERPNCSGVLLTSTAQEPRCLGPGDEFSECAECPKLVVVRPGSFLMGSPSSEKSRQNSEGPQRSVVIEYPLAVAKLETTFDEWDACIADGGCRGHRPSDEGWGRGKRPVINVSWEDAQSYLKWLSSKTGATYRLLSEAEWEYVARAMTKTPFSTGKTITAQQSNFNGNYTYNGSSKGKNRKKTVEVGGFSPNEFGLYDLHGNVWEWVEDCYVDSYNSVRSDGNAWAMEDCIYRVYRGGAWNSVPGLLRSASRSKGYSGYRFNGLGFRVARDVEPSE